MIGSRKIVEMPRKQEGQPKGVELTEVIWREAVDFRVRLLEEVVNTVFRRGEIRLVPPRF